MVWRKDSTATAILARQHGIAIDDIVTVMPDPFKCELDFLKRFEAWMVRHDADSPVPFKPGKTLAQYMPNKTFTGVSSASEETYSERTGST